MQPYILMVNRDDLSIQKEIEVLDGNASISRIAFINDQILVFINDTDRKSGITSYYFQTITKDLEYSKMKVDIASFQREKKLFSSSGNFEFIESQDQEYFAVFYNLPYERNEPEKFAAAIFDKDLKKINQKDYQLQETDRDIELLNKHLSDNGDLFLSARQVTERGMLGGAKDFDQLFFQVMPDGSLIKNKFKLPGKRIVDYTFISNEKNQLICAGLYGDEKGRGVLGSFYARLDVTTKEWVKESYKPFDSDFITDGWSNREKNKADRKKDKGKDPILEDYEIRNLVTLPDNSSILIAEQFYITTVTYTDQNGNIQTKDIYNYNHVIVVRVDAKGEILWNTKVQKEQASTNDGGYYSSYAFYPDDDALYIMFNDNLKNYTKGNVVGGETFKTSFTKGKKNVVSIVKIEYLRGDKKKAKLFSGKDIAMLVVPKAHFAAFDSKELYFYARSKKKEKIGVVKL